MQEVEVLEPWQEPIKSGRVMLLNLNLYILHSVNGFHKLCALLEQRTFESFVCKLFIIVFLISHYHRFCFEQPIMSLQ